MFNFVRFCCASTRDDDIDGANNRQAIDPNSNDQVEKRLRKLKNVLAEYMHFERSLGIKDVDVIKLIEVVLNQYSNNEVPKKDLQ